MLWAYTQSFSSYSQFRLSAISLKIGVKMEYAV